MGHTRLGNIPTGKKWKAVVEALAASRDDIVTFGILSEDIELVASKTLEAAKAGLNRALDDEGLKYTFFVLTQLAIASREADWKTRLSQVGIEVPTETSPFALSAEVHKSIDDYLSKRGQGSDISEIAQQAAGEALTSLTAEEAKSLFGTGESELRNAVRRLSTSRGFADLGQKFFGRFMSRFLNFYLSRATAAQVGGSKFQSTTDVSRFNNLLEQHCEQSARIVRDFCGEWYSKTEYRQGIDLENTSRFMAVAVKKLQSELERQRKNL
jgi:hypothetical protein